ncbi:MAG: alanine racemase [Actinomycetota bacterium]|nr:alanine racemase [Actinomycetota bacterium]
MTSPDRALARVRLDTVRRNCERLLLLLADGAQLCAVVKAQGYGHGAVQCARAARDGGATWIAVATAAEAVELRRAGIEGRVLVMGALTAPETRAAVAAEADVVVWDRCFLDSIPTGAAGPTRVHVKLDTGMGRLGTKDPEVARALIEQADSTPGVELAGLMTHFATADELGDLHFPAQLDRFRAFVGELGERADNLLVHAANSAATFRERGCHFDMVRSGVAIYGLDPFGEDPRARGLEPALELESYVAAVKRFEPGESAGYGRRWTAAEPTCVGTVPIGYGDGWRRALTNDCDVLVRGRRRPLVGTVSMDNVTVELGLDTDVQPGDTAVLIGAQGEERILCEEVAGRLDTINYEVVCGLSPRVTRRHEG